eukprot:scaffold42064_cov75-Phaeocystis_antarctica.AAC.1
MADAVSPCSHSRLRPSVARKTRRFLHGTGKPNRPFGRGTHSSGHAARASSSWSSARSGGIAWELVNIGNRVTH